MNIPSLTYRDLPAAMDELRDVYGLEIDWHDEELAEIRWRGGVALAQVDQPELVHGPKAGHAWMYVQVDDPDAHYTRALAKGARVLDEPHTTSDGLQRGYRALDREGNLWNFVLYRFDL
jgi:uncharacterized glyoxalase superfamily protein PhnB